ncbi:MAG: hypothetical protein Q9188_003720 [Gyalolechia gomerana]
MDNNKPHDQRDSEDFWKVEADDHEFWDAYISTRPNYSKPFYQIIYHYHSAHSSSSDVAHDVGCGAGQVTAELALHYSHVVASDTNEDHLAVAKGRLARTFGESRISYIHAKAEHLGLHNPEGSADLIAAAEVVVLMDRDSGLQSFAQVLKPGGTLAVWFYGRPTFSEPSLRTQAQPILDKIMLLIWSKVIRPSGPRRAWGFKRCADAMESWLDFLPFSTDVWTDVQRYKWNTYGTLPFFGKEACGYEIQPTCNVGRGEKVVISEDPKFWMNKWDVAALNEYFSVLFPGFREAIGEGDKEIDSLFDELTEMMGGEGMTKEFTDLQRGLGVTLSPGSSISSNFTVAPRWSLYRAPAPKFIVDVHSEEDVGATVRCCNKRNIKFLAQSRGNGWADTLNLGDYGLLINLAGLNQISFDNDKTVATIE